MMAPGTPLEAAILTHFGAEYRRPNGSLDRQALGRLVFSDPDRLAELESIVHPAINERLARLVLESNARHPRAVVIEAIKLVEAGHAAGCDEIWLVVCDPQTQLARLVGRGMDPADARQRIAAQGASLPLWRSAATRVIDTEGSLAEVEREVDAALSSSIG